MPQNPSLCWGFTMSCWILPPLNPSFTKPFSAPLGSPSFRNRLFFARFPFKISAPFSSRFDVVRQSNRNIRTRIPLSSGEQGQNPSDIAGEEAREAVMEVLLESGASPEDSVGIASNCPKYVEMLVGNVRELDEHSLWSSWKNEMGGGDEDDGNLDFKKKVYFMAKRKGDNGIFPFLETLGLSQSSSMRIAGYLHLERLPELIRKVKFVKDMLFSGSCSELIIGRHARRLMMNLSIFADEDIQQTLSFFEKMEARRGGLDMLGVEDMSFPCLIESFPRLLLCSVENHWKPLIEYFEFLGIQKGHIKNILLLYPSITFYGIEKDIKPRVLALHKVGVKDKDIGRMLLKYPWILSTSMQNNYGEIRHFFELEKVPKSSVDSAVKSWPYLLGCSTDKMKLMVKQFEKLGVRNKMLGSVISSSPQLLLVKPNEFLEVVLFMEEVGLDDETIGRILSRCPQIFASSIEGTLRKKLKLLVDFGISSNHLPRVIRKYPELFLSDVENTLLPRMRYLMEKGLSKREVCSMVYRFSPLLGYSIEVCLKPKLDFLVGTMQKPLKDVVEYPRYFSYSLEKKIKPRFWVLKGRNRHCSLKDMLGKNDEDFAEAYMDIGRMLILP